LVRFRWLLILSFVVLNLSLTHAAFKNWIVVTNLLAVLLLVNVVLLWVYVFSVPKDWGLRWIVALGLVVYMSWFTYNIFCFYFGPEA
jgi:hypothetical protein